MRYRDADLRGIPVITKSGDKVGKLAAFVIDAEHHEVAQYVVARASLLSSIMPDELLVHPGQVVSLDGEMMVVEDAAVTERAEARQLAKRAAEPAAGGTSTMALKK
ncbi:MAG TPA: PRC-barrel domain-containing protein [Candidatus Binatia bacterium]|jgi:sporulation protein YlmC with PRC-barrel domain|nr:PRC-barrel domain-containing protein [Candidatus Binatia bacterium]